MILTSSKYKRLYLISAATLFLGLAVSCSDNETSTVTPGNSKELKVYLSLSPFGQPGNTKAIVDAENQDQWSYFDFSDGDEVGFYANTTKGAVSNMAMLYSAGQDASGNNYSSFGPADDSDFEANTIIGNNVFIYFPYSADIPTQQPSESYGMPLRTKTDPYTEISDLDGPWRCIDFLTSNAIDASDLQEYGFLSGNMVHNFSELIIMRGPGFDAPTVPEGSDADPYQITVKLTEPITHVNVTSSLSPWRVNVSLEYDETYTPGGETNFDPYTWMAWEGGNYGMTETDAVGVPAWYVILPTIGQDAAETKSMVEYIQLYDNDGVLQTIKDLYLSGPTGYVHRQPGNYLESQWRYPMQISMQELVPTVFPFTIEPWDEDNITNARTRGITQQNFMQWRSAYNTYLASIRSTTYDQTLTPYGDKIMTGGTSYWHFYILESITLTDDYISNGMIIPKLEDVIDGKSSPAASPVTVSGLTVPFVGEMSNTYDSLVNLTLDMPYLDLPDQSIPTGVMVNSLTGGGIDNCYVNQGYISVTGPAGMFAGQMNGGTITNSKASGIVIGSASDASSGYLVGNSSSTGVFTGNNSTVVFSNPTP